MKLKKNQKIKSYNDFKLHFTEPNLFNKTFEDSLTTKNSQVKNKKKIMSLTTFKNLNKLKLNNRRTNQNETIPLAEKIFKNRNWNKFKMIKIFTDNHNINKLLINSSYSNSLSKKDHSNFNNNSLNLINMNNLKESFYPIKSTKEKNMNALKSIIDIKNNCFPLKNKFTFLKNKIKFKGIKKENLGESEKSNLYLTEGNKENINNNYNNIFLNNNNINRQIYYNKNNNDFYIDIVNHVLDDNKINNEEFISFM